MASRTGCCEAPGRWECRSISRSALKIDSINSGSQEAPVLNKVKRIVKVLGMVNSTPAFTEQPKVVNGFSDLMVEVFGDRGKHARSAVGMAALPMNIPVEVEMVVEVEGK